MSCDDQLGMYTEADSVLRVQRAAYKTLIIVEAIIFVQHKELQDVVCGLEGHSFITTGKRHPVRDSPLNQPCLV